MARALEFLSANFEHQPTLAEAARHAHLSEFHFQRLFTRWAGISPKRYVQVLTLERAKASLLASRSVLDAALDAGLSGPSRLHDLFVRVDAVTPGEFKRGGRGLDIAYGFHDSPFGEALIMTSARGLCGIAFTRDADRAGALDGMRAHWPNADIREDAAATADAAALAFGGDAPRGEAFRLYLHGTAFQIKVWQALLGIAPGSVCSYGDVARAAGRPGASRAAGAAVGRNPLAWLIPCHRVIRKSGALGGYRWGLERKLAMLSLEAARAGEAA